MLSSFCDSNCDLCPLHKSAHSVCIPGKGAEKNIKLVVVGEAPGTDEDKRGVCFVGQAGTLLDTLLDEAGIDKKHVRLENLARCFPRDDKGLTRQPTEKEVSACLPYFYTTLMSIIENQNEPPLLLALGNVSLRTLTGYDKITKNGGVFFDLVIPEEHMEQFGSLLEVGIKVIGTIHPAAHIRSTQSGYRQRIASHLTVVNRKLNKEESVDYWKDYRWIDNVKDFEKWVSLAIRRYENGEINWVAFDLETTGLEVYDRVNHYTVCFSLCEEPGKAIVVPLRHKDSPWKDDEFTMGRVVELLKHLVSKVPVAGWNISFDVKWSMIHLGVEEWKGIGFDGYLARRWLFGSDRAHDLNSVAAEELGFNGHGNDIWSEIKNLPKELQTFANTSKETLIRYSAGDADATLQLCDSLRSQMIEGECLTNFEQLSLAGVLPICEMEIDGVYISPTTNEYLRRKYPEKMGPLVEFIKETSYGRETVNHLKQRLGKDGKPSPLEFNLASDVTLRYLMFDAMRLPIRENAKTGPVTDREVVEELIEYCNKKGMELERKILEAINEWRTHKHTYANFIKNIPEYTKWDGFFHTNYNIAGTDTGRFSSSKPSLHGQQKGSEAREQFVSRWMNKGGLIVSADQAQMEVRVLAALAKDKALIETIKSGVDLHTANASRMYKVPIEEVTKELRDHAKRSSFGVIYGIGADTLAARLGCTVEEAEAIIKAWYDAFPGTLSFQKREYKEAQETEYVSTPFGRVRFIPDIKKSRWGDKAWRRSINSNIQSTASDITYTALLELKKEVKYLGLKSKVFGFVHDSIIADVYPGELWRMMELQKKFMMDWPNETYEWMDGLVKTDFEICTAWGLPCSVVNWAGDEITVKGPAVNVELLWNELTRVDGVIITKEMEGEEELTMSFSREVPF